MRKAAFKSTVRLVTALLVDGVVLSINPTINGKTIYYPDAWFGPEKYDAKDFAWMAEKLRSAGAKRYTDNFVRLNVLPGTVDWFDDAGWATILNNLEIAASVARDAGLEGILLDTEQYASHVGIAPFTYARQPGKDKNTFMNYCEQARRRGREFGARCGKIYPGMSLLLTFANAAVYNEIGWKGEYPLQKSTYNLMPGFLDGLLDAVPKIQLHDVWESTYSDRTHTQFAVAYDRIRNQTARLSKNPQGYRKNLRAGFGVWLAGAEGPEVYDAHDFSKNPFTPDEAEHALSFALEHCDRYTWLYAGRMPVFFDLKLPQEYKDALIAAKKPHADRDWQPPAGEPDPMAARTSDEPSRIVIEAEDMVITSITGTKPVLANGEVGLENWGQSGKMVTIVPGLYDTGIVRFTIPRAMPDGCYRVSMRVRYPFKKDGTTARYRDGMVAAESSSESKPWTRIQFGDREKGTYCNYGKWTWIELFGPNQPFKSNDAGPRTLQHISPNRYYIELEDDSKITYYLIEVDQFEFRREP